LLSAETKALASVLPKIFGYYIVQAGGPVDSENALLTASSIQNQIILNSTAKLSFSDNLSSIECKLNELPFLPESIDAILLFHVLEFSTNTHEMLKEAYEALIKGGHLIIIGFNPHSMWGVSRFFKREKNSIWDANWLSPKKLRRRLNDVGFQVGDYQTFYFRPPTRKPKKMLFIEGLGQMLWPYCGASYMFVARKTSTELTPIKGVKRLMLPPKIAESLPKPTSRVTQ
jgi:SAM-dependent methyltransferase